MASSMLSLATNFVLSRIIANIRKGFKYSTIIIVSHRLSAIKEMDLIYFFAGPNVMYKGRHERLLVKLPDYREFFKGQLDENDS